MRIIHFETHGILGIAADEGSGWHGLTQQDSGFPGTLPELIAQGADLLRIGRSLAQSPTSRPQRCPSAAAGARTAENSVCRSQLR